MKSDLEKTIHPKTKRSLVFSTLLAMTLGTGIFLGGESFLSSKQEELNAYRKANTFIAELKGRQYSCYPQSMQQNDQLICEQINIEKYK